ncbi:olfactory receptor 2AG1-like [Hoplias malabaricus]|uniref:olfactory receptor 2AG1-like n=1 Tax=Hoplias malabaricus TaxID=27720 RepID=UPI003462BE95
MNTTRRDRADCANFSLPSFNGTLQLLPWFPDVASCQFWSIVHNEVVLHISEVLILIFFLFSLVVNTVLLVGLQHSEALSWQPRYILLKNLMLSDLLQSLIMAPTVLYCLFYRQTLSFGGWCLVQYFTAIVAIASSLLTLFFMVLERYVYICHSIHYLAVMTRVRVHICLSFIWLIAVALATTFLIVVMSGKPRLGMTLPGLLCEPAVIQLGMEFPTHFEMMKKVIMLIMLFLALVLFSFSYCCMYCEAQQAVQPFQQDNVRAQRTVAFYLAIFFVQMTPSAFMFVTMFHNEEDYHLLIVVLFLIPPCVNPLAYGFRNEEVRKAIENVCSFRMTERL